MFFHKKKTPPPKPLRLSLDIKGGVIAYDLVRSNRRTLGIQVKRDGDVIVRAPRRMAEADIVEWVTARAAWIEKHRQNFEKTRAAPLKYVAGETHFFLGRSYTLELKPARRPGVQIEGESLVVKTRYVDDPVKVEKLIKAFYREQAAALFPSYIEQAFSAFQAMGYKLPSIKMRWMKRHWGSLSAKGVMTLNTKLVRAPKHLIDYVLVHELCHLAHMNHGKGFYALMTKLMPDWKPRKKALEAFMT